MLCSRKTRGRIPCSHDFHTSARGSAPQGAVLNHRKLSRGDLRQATPGSTLHAGTRLRGPRHLAIYEEEKLARSRKVCRQTVGSQGCACKIETGQSGQGTPDSGEAFGRNGRLRPSGCKSEKAGTIPSQDRANFHPKTCRWFGRFVKGASSGSRGEKGEAKTGRISRNSPCDGDRSKEKRAFAGLRISKEGLAPQARC